MIFTDSADYKKRIFATDFEYSKDNLADCELKIFSLKIFENKFKIWNYARKQFLKTVFFDLFVDFQLDNYYGYLIFTKENSLI